MYLFKILMMFTLMAYTGGGTELGPFVHFIHFVVGVHGHDIQRQW